MRLTTAIFLLGATLGTGLTGATTPAGPSATTLAGPATETSSVTWSVTPATEEGPDDRVSFRLRLEPGEQHSDHLAVTNFSEQEVTFDLTASDGILSENGDFGLLPGDQEPSGTGAWIEIQEDVTVEAEESTVVPFTITVPEDALPGDQPGGVAATIAGGDGQIGVDAGVGVRIHLRVAGDVVPQVVLTDVAASYTTSWNPVEPGVLDVEWTVANNGNVRLGAHQVLTVLAPLGLDPGAAQQMVAEQREVLPGQSATFGASVEAWPLGRLTARLASTQQVVGEDVVEAALPAAVAEVSVAAVPWPHLMILALLVLVVVAALVRRRRARARVARAVAAARAEGVREGAGSEGGGEDFAGTAPADDAAGTPGNGAADSERHQEFTPR